MAKTARTDNTAESRLARGTDLRAGNRNHAMISSARKVTT